MEVRFVCEGGVLWMTMFHDKYLGTDSQNFRMNISTAFKLDKSQLGPFSKLLGQNLCKT